MKLKVEFFGMLAELIDSDNVFIEIPQGSSINEVEQEIFSKHPELKNRTYSWALNQQIVPLNTVIQEECDLAMLPPFAGG